MPVHTRAHGTRVCVCGTAYPSLRREDRWATRRNERKTRFIRGFLMCASESRTKYTDPIVTPLSKSVSPTVLLGNVLGSHQ